MGLALPEGAVKDEVAPLVGTFSVTGDEMISSRDGMGRLRKDQQPRINEGQWQYEPVLTTSLSRGTGLRTYLSPEGIDLVDNQSLHPFDGIFFFKSKVKGLHTTKIKKRG